MSSPTPASPQHQVLCLYLTGSSAASARALVNTRRFCETYLAPHYTLEIVDVSLHPQRVQDGQVVAVPTLVRTEPLPVRRFVGDLSDPARLMLALGLRAEPPPGAAAAPPR